MTCEEKLRLTTVPGWFARMEIVAADCPCAAKAIRGIAKIIQKPRGKNFVADFSFTGIWLCLYGNCNRKKFWLFVGANVKKLTPFVVTGVLVTGTQAAFSPRADDAYSPRPLVQAGQFKVMADAVYEMAMLEAVICSIGRVSAEICTESISPLK